MQQRHQHPRTLIAVVAFLVVLAIMGTLAAGSGWDDWYRTIEKPGWLVPLWVFFIVAPVYYAIGGFILYRLLTRTDDASRRTRLALVVLTVLVLAANEAWNVLFLARESVTGGFFGLVLFATLVIALWIGLWKTGRRIEASVLLPYVLWVGYDLTWAFALWRMN